MLQVTICMENWSNYSKIESAGSCWRRWTCWRSRIGPKERWFI